LRQRIATPPGGALVSAYPPGTKPLRPHFPARNVVMAGLVQGVLVVEASATSGALVTARSAGEEGRLVFAVPGDITRGNSAGANALLRDGAIACTSPEELLADLAPLLQGDLADLARRRAVPPQDAGTNAASLAQPTGHAATLYGAIRHHPLSHDDLLIRFVPSAMTQGEFAGALLDLELDGLIATLPGRIYGPRMR
jgi:DNA processing protein